MVLKIEVSLVNSIFCQHCQPSPPAELGHVIAPVPLEAVGESPCEGLLGLLQEPHLVHAAQHPVVQGPDVCALFVTVRVRVRRVRRLGQHLDRS